MMDRRLWKIEMIQVTCSSKNAMFMSATKDKRRQWTLPSIRRPEKKGKLKKKNLPSKAYLKLLRWPVTGFCLSRFPRTSAVCVGVIVPLFALVLLSLGFGAKLCEYEAPAEIEANNNAVEQVCEICFKLCFVNLLSQNLLLCVSRSSMQTCLRRL